jgi:hypothetical protein
LKLLRAFALLTLAPLLPACSGGIACDDSLARSVIIRVVDEGGRNVPDARVTYSHEGGAEEQAGCVLFSDGTTCNGWGAGTEQTGAFVIKAASADGTRHAEGRVTVEEGTCHVDTEELRLTLR